jgi:hypothetical protein
VSRLQDLLVCGAGVLAIAGPASAQSESPAPAQAATAPTPDPAAQDAAPAPVTSVVITGSRVIRNGDSSPSPVTVVSADDLMTARPGATLAAALPTIPVFAGSRGASSNPTTAGSAAGGARLARASSTR